MKIKWNEVTWYSKIAAVVLFVGTAIFSFMIGTWFEQANQYLREVSELSAPVATHTNTNTSNTSNTTNPLNPSQEVVNSYTSKELPEEVQITYIAPKDYKYYETIVGGFSDSNKKITDDDLITANTVAFLYKPYTKQDIMRESVEAAVRWIPTQVAPEHVKVVKFKVENGVAHYLLNVNLPGAGYAGISIRTAEATLLVEKTLHLFPEIKEVRLWDTK